METLRILHVEDSEGDFELIRRKIESAGYQVDARRVDTGRDMAEALVERRWDLILASDSMPGIDGFDALNILHEHDEDIPLIVLSGAIGEEATVELMRAGAADYVLKDNLTRLVPAVTREIADAGQRRALRLAEQRLRERERMLTTALRVAHLGSWEQNYRDDTLWWSAEFYAILGQPLAYEPSTDGSYADVAAPEDREQVQQALEAVFQRGESSALEHRIVCADGTVRWVYARLEPELDEEGQLYRLVGTVLDITPRKEAEAALRFQAYLLDTVEQAVIATDLEGQIVYWNSFSEELYGWKSDEVVGRLIHEVTPTEISAVEAIEIWNQLRSGRSWSGEFLVRHRDGHEFWAHVSDSLVRREDGTQVGVIGISYDVTDQRQAQEALRESEANYRTLMEQAADGIVVLDSDFRILDVNGRVCEMFGYEADELIGQLPFDFLHPDELRERLPAVLDPQSMEKLDRGQTVVNERRLRHKDASYIPTEASTRKLEDGRVISIIRDITERKTAEDALRRSERDFRNIFEQANDSIFVFTRLTREILDVNQRACELYGYEQGDFIGRSMTVLAPQLTEQEFDADLSYSLSTRREFEITRYRLDGSPVRVLVSDSAIDFRGQAAVMSIQHDVTSRRELEGQLRHRTFYDLLTELPNRALFQERVGHALVRARQNGAEIAVLMLDLDRFRIINESLGHDLGDRLLVAVSGRLRAVVRAEDTVARIGGDEFAFLLDNIDDHRDAIFVADQIGNLFRQPFELADSEIHVTASIGIVFSADGRLGVGQLLRNVDVATYRAKSDGRAQYEVFDPSMDGSVAGRLRLESDLRGAIERDELEVYFQPIVDLSSEAVIGMEALARWDHPLQGRVPPAAFVPLAEESGLIRALGQRVLTRACQQWRDWHERYTPDRPLVLNVNLSANEFQHPEIVRDIANVLESTGLDPDLLQLEITETVIMADVTATNLTLRQLKDLGVRLAVDDFGTGYSSLAYLKRFPVDALKIDKSFIAGLGKDPEDTAIVRSIISLTSTLGLDVTAEGVETLEAVERLREMACGTVQGYFFCEPLPVESIEGLWANELRLDSDWRPLVAD